MPSEPRPAGPVVTGAIAATGATANTAVASEVLILLEAGDCIVDVEAQPPGSSSWIKLGTEGIGIDASSDVGKVFAAPACKIRLNCTTYTSSTNFWLIPMRHEQY